MYNPEIVSQFKHLISKSNYSGAKKALYEYLTENPFDHSTRKVYINYVRKQNSRLRHARRHYTQNRYQSKFQFESP